MFEILGFLLNILLYFFVKLQDEGEMTLSDLYKKNLDDDEDGEDFVEEGEEEEVIIF